MTLGVVVIGRNEGQRLVNCLKSIRVDRLVYVDSGSTDDSLKSAQELGAETVELDLSIPFTAARARNEGFKRLLQVDPDLDYVFFVDGDCVVDPTWLDNAVACLDQKPSVAVVCGQRQEINPQASIYNGLCDFEWNTPIGEASACGGDAVFRAKVFKELDGYDPSFIAGEEPELCFRIRQLGYTIERMDAVMTYHDAAMTRFSQWWKRTERSGHAYYLGWAKHGRNSEEKYYARDLRSIFLWVSVGLIGLAVAIISLSLWPLLVVLGVYGVQSLRIFKRLDPRYQHYPLRLRLVYSASLLGGKFPQALGAIRAHRIKSRGEQATLVEYK